MRYKGVIAILTDEEKESAVKLAKAFDVLPDTKKEYILGFADGMAHALNKEDDNERDNGEQVGSDTTG